MSQWRYSCNKIDYVNVYKYITIFVTLSIEDGLVLVRLLEHPRRRNLGDDHENEATQMLITRSVLVQMSSMRAQMKGIGDGFQIMYAFLQLYHSAAILLFTAKLHFSGGKKSGSNMSSFERTTWLTSHKPNRFIFGSYPWIL